VTAITSIALDHQKYLGNTLAEIAREKAGIVKAGVPLVLGTMPPDAAAAIEAIALQRGADIIRAAPGDVSGLAVGLAGAHQRDNAAVALRILEALDKRGVCVPRAAIAEGLAHPHWPGRLDLRRLPDGRELLLDAAHNPAGAAALASYLRGWHTDEPRPPLVFAAMRDKDVDNMFAALLPVVGPLIVTGASTRRAADPDELAAAAQRVAPRTRLLVTRSPEEALAAAWRIGPRIVVAGSIFLLGDVLKSIDAA
jgi:dihydrofolate synthase/folylpolyglutamate synthase